jgi:hemerythrin-like domain-containing protein
MIDQLHQDHIHIARLLDFIDREVVKAGTAERPDYHLLNEVMYYMTHYPDLYHHPHEDRIFARLRATGKVPVSEIDEVSEQHKTLLEQGLRFRELLEAILRTEGVRVDDFVATAQAYSRLQRAHLDREEGVLFDAARQFLSEADWRAIDAAWEGAPDPLFGAVVKAQYAYLAKALERG